VIGEPPAFLQSGRTNRETYYALRQQLLEAKELDRGVFEPQVRTGRNTGSPHLAELDAEEGSDLAGEAGEIEQIDIAAGRAQSLVRELLTFARREPSQPKPVNLKELVTKVTRLLRASMSPMIRLRCDSPGPMVVLCDPTGVPQNVGQLRCHFLFSV